MKDITAAGELLPEDMADFSIEVFSKKNTLIGDRVFKIITHIPTGHSMAMSGGDLETAEKIQQWIKIFNNLSTEASAMEKELTEEELKVQLEEMRQSIENHYNPGSYPNAGKLEISATWATRQENEEIEKERLVQEEYEEFMRNLPVEGRHKIKKEGLLNLIRQHREKRGK